jgi:hypothetical protein
MRVNIVQILRTHVLDGKRRTVEIIPGMGGGEKMGED